MDADFSVPDEGAEGPTEKSGAPMPLKADVSAPLEKSGAAAPSAAQPSASQEKSGSAAAGVAAKPKPLEKSGAAASAASAATEAPMEKSRAAPVAAAHDARVPTREFPHCAAEVDAGYLLCPYCESQIIMETPQQRRVPPIVSSVNTGLCHEPELAGTWDEQVLTKELHLTAYKDGVGGVCVGGALVGVVCEVVGGGCGVVLARWLVSGGVRDTS